MRLFALVVGAFLVNVALVLVLVLVPRDVDYRALERSVEGEVALLVEFMGDKPALRIDALRERYSSVPVRLMDTGTLPPSAARVREGQHSHELFSDWEGDFLAVRLEGGQALLIGPYETLQGPPVQELLGVLVASLVLWALVVFFAMWPTLRAIRRLAVVADRLRQGDFSARAPESKDLAPLSDAFNRMAEATQTMVEAQRELLHAVSHELRTPLARLEYAVEGLARADGHAQHQAELASVHEELDGIDQLVGELLDWTRAGAPPRAERVPLEPVVTQARVGVKVDIELRAPSPVWASRHALQQVVDNLVRNAALHGEPPIVVRAQRVSHGVWLEVEDGGVGIPAGRFASMLEPFQQLEPGDGTGLGLAIVARVVAAHGGRVEARRTPGRFMVRTFWPAEPTDR